MCTKHIFLIYFSILAVMLVSCDDRNDSAADNSKQGAITFVSGVSNYGVRVSGDGSQWTAGDKIGIYMMESGKITASAYSNVPYEAESSAQTTAFRAVEASICYPTDGTAVDFMAYYPYSSTITDMIYPVGLADQSAGLAAHDLLYAKAVNGSLGFTEGSISFGFTHQLSKIILNLVDEDNNTIAPDAGEIFIKGMNVVADFDLRTAVLTDAAATADIIPYSNSNSVEAILLPFTIRAGHEVTLAVDGNQYKWTMNNNYSGLEIKAGYSYTFKITVKMSSATVDAILVGYDGSSITPWGDGGADNHTKEPVEGVEIPDDFETITLLAGESVKSALSGATASKVAIVLKNGGSYTESSGISVPASITSLMIVGEGGLTMPTIYFAGSMTVTGDMDFIKLYNINLYGESNTSYFLNQSAAVTIGQIVIESCILHDLRGVVRLQTNASKINSYIITNSIIYTIGTYNLLTVDSGSVLEIAISRSTFYNLAGRGIYLNAMPESATVSVNQCTFNVGPRYAIVQFSSAGRGTLTFTNNIVGLPYNQDRGVSVGSNATSISTNNNYYVSDTIWYGQNVEDIVGDDCGYTSAELFADPDNGNFTQFVLAAGDPRWY